MAVKDKKYLVEIYKDKLGKVKAGRSIITFKSLSDVSLSSLENLLKEAERSFPHQKN